MVSRSEQTRQSRGLRSDRAVDEDGAWTLSANRRSSAARNAGSRSRACASPRARIDEVAAAWSRPVEPDVADAPLELKEACVRAAHDFIAEHGVERLSLREVSRRLGVSHQAPYKHYPSRDHLLAEVVRRCLRQFADHLDDRGEHADPREDLGALGRRYLAFASEHPLQYRLMFGTPWPASAEQLGLVTVPATRRTCCVRC